MSLMYWGPQYNFDLRIEYCSVSPQYLRIFLPFRRNFPINFLLPREYKGGKNVRTREYGNSLFKKEE